MKKLICLFAMLLTVGCAKAVYRPYVGAQQAWPTAEGSIVNVKYDLPIFTSLPPAPYDVIGELRIESMFFETPEEGHMPELVKKAMELGADAVVLVQGRIYFSTNYGPRQSDFVPGGKAPTLSQVNTFNPESFKSGVTILAIRWIGDPPPGLPANPARNPEPEAEMAPMEMTPPPAMEEMTIAPESEPVPAPEPAPVMEDEPVEMVPSEEPAPAPEPVPDAEPETDTEPATDTKPEPLPGDVGSAP